MHPYVLQTFLNVRHFIAAEGTLKKGDMIYKKEFGDVQPEFIGTYEEHSKEYPRTIIVKKDDKLSEFFEISVEIAVTTVLKVENLHVKNINS